MRTSDPEKRSCPRAHAPSCGWRSRLRLVALLLMGLVTPLAAAGEEWAVRQAAASAAGTSGCLLESKRQALPDGYRETWAQIVVDDHAVRVTSESVLDPGDGDIGLEVDGGDFVPLDEVIDGRTAAFTSRYKALIEAFERGRRVRVQLRFWPTWPKTGTHAATFSLIGFTRARARLADCRTP